MIAWEGLKLFLIVFCVVVYGSCFYGTECDQ